MALYDARGRCRVSMTSAHIRALSDGNYFVEHGLELLPTLRLEPYCRQCAAIGASARLLGQRMGQYLRWQCGHRAGFVRIAPELEHQPLLSALGWGIRCTDCHAPAEAANARTDATFEVSCPCTIRWMANPLETAVGSPAMASLGRSKSL